MEVVREAALRLASQHLNLASSVKELCESGSRDVSGLSSNESAVEVTEGVWLAVLSCCDTSDPLLSATQRTQLRAVLQTASLLLDTLLFSSRHFLHCLVKQQLECVPLEAVCALHKASLITLESILKGSAIAVQYIVTAVVSLSSCDGCAEAQKTLMQNVAEMLCDLVERQSPEAVEVVEQLPGALLACQLPSGYTFLRAALEGPCTASASTEMASLMLSSYLAHPAMTLLEAVSQQTSWQYSHLAHSTTSFYSDLLSLLGTVQFAEQMQKALSVEQLNWPGVLQAVACFLHHGEGASERLTELVEELVSVGLDSEDSHLLTSGLLFARQASLEGAHLFPSYASWIQRMFGDNPSSVVKGKKELLLLLKTLTSLVPSDPLFALRAHASHPPRRLTKCLSQINDYMSLVSTRLEDLGEKVGAAAQDDMDANGDVEKALTHYRQTGLIPQFLTEASIFKQPYFLGRFLPSLLQSTSSVSEDRERFINALARDKLIPPRMMKRYKRACQVKEKGAQYCSDVTSLLEQLPTVVTEDRDLAKLLSLLSSAIAQEVSQQQTLSPATSLQLVEQILNIFGKVVLCQDTNSGWAGKLLAMLSSHTSLHTPLYHRLAELLSTQLVDLLPAQLVSLTVLLSQLFTQSPVLARVEDNGQVLESGRDYCTSLLAHLRHDVVAQFMRFSCLFVEQITLSESSVCLPVNLLSKMVYVYKREKYFQQDNGEANALEAVEKLLQDHPRFSEQWHSCEVGFQQWLSWELDVGPDDTSLTKLKRQCYRWNEVFGEYLPQSTAEQLFPVLFKSLANIKFCMDFFVILQELSHLLLNAHTPSSPLLESLQTILSGCCSGSAVVADSVRLAMALPPSLLFCGCKEDMYSIAHFVQQTLVPHTQLNMILPLHITQWLVLGACSISETVFHELCGMAPTFTASVMVHWPLLQSLCRCTAEVAHTVSWIHNEVHEHVPLTTSSALLPQLGIAMCNYLKHKGEPALARLVHLPPQATVIVALCCVQWLAQHSLQPHPVMERILQACIKVVPSTVEVFITDSEVVPDSVKVQHSQTLSEFRATFDCRPSGLYCNMILLKLVGKLSGSLVDVLLAESPFLWLCVRAHAQCFSFSVPLPTLPPPTLHLFSVEFIADSKANLVALVDRANHHQLQAVLDHCHSELKQVILSKLNSKLF